MALKLTAAPTAEPVSLAEAKVHLRANLDDTSEDALIGMYISAARSDAENTCRRALVTQQWDLFLDAFPLRSYYGVQAGYVPIDQLPSAWMTQRNYAVRFRGGRIDLPFPRLQSVQSIKYRDTAGAIQTLDATKYTVDDASEPGVVTPSPDSYWPDTQNITNAVQLSYTAGYGDAAAVPAGIKAWILLRVGAFYENREEISVAQRVTVQELPFVDGLLDPYRIASYV